MPDAALEREAGRHQGHAPFRPGPIGSFVPLPDATRKTTLARRPLSRKFWLQSPAQRRVILNNFEKDASSPARPIPRSFKVAKTSW